MLEPDQIARGVEVSEPDIAIETKSSFPHSGALLLRASWWPLRSLCFNCVRLSDRSCNPFFVSDLERCFSGADGRLRNSFIVDGHLPALVLAVWRDVFVSAVTGYTVYSLGLLL